MTLQTRLQKLEAQRSGQCARDWQRINEIFRTLPSEILEAFVYHPDAVPATYDAALNEVYKLYTPQVEAYAESITPCGPVESWTDDELCGYLSPERATARAI